MIGTKLAHYEITGHLGTGGMGEVYQATDSKLGRNVAIKLLPEAFTHDRERAARFEREARVLASLNHPNIAAIYGIEESGGRKFIVMELVGGETLAERIKRGAVHIDQALGIAKEIAEGLEAAHERGIIHRDLKPANIKVTPSGKVKVLDFGLAKPFAGGTASTSLSNSPTVSMDATQQGMILGTAAYMAPEQAKGLEVDARTDIFAFGAVLYEMLTGRQAFGGEDLPDILSKVLRSDPDWTLLPAGLPSNLRRVLTRCLQKDLYSRTRNIADARMDLEEAEVAVPIAPPGGTKARRLSGRSLIAVLGLCLALAVGFGLWTGRLWERRNQPTVIEWRGDLLGGSTTASGPRISPDGQMLAFHAMVDGQTQVAVMRPQSGNWTVLSHDRTKGLVEEISWSHDGTRIFFSRTAEVPHGIFSIPSLGGEERLILEDAATPEALPDGSLLVSRLNAQRFLQLYHFWPETGRLEALDALLGETGTNGGFVRVFSDGREAVFRGKTSAAPGQRGLYAIDLATGRSRRLAPGLPVADVTAIATTPDGKWVLFNIPSGNVDRIVEVPRDGSAVVRPVLTLARPGSMDVGPDGSIYVDHETRISEVFSYSPLNGKVERLTLPDTTVTVQQVRMLLPLPEGRLLFGTVASGRRQLAVLAPGKDAVPFLETEEETSAPAALVGRDRVAFLIGTPPNQRIAIASLSDGRIVGRLQKPNSGNVRALAGSPDGNSLYYVESGFVWATTSGGGEPRKIHEGDRVAVDPSDHSLIIEVTTKDGVRLVRVPPSGGAEQPISMPSGLRLIADLSPSAVAPDGRIAVRYAPKDNWFWPTGILDPRTGKLADLPGVRDLDMNHASWAPDGRLFSVALPERSSLWRFRPVSSGK